MRTFEAKIAQREMTPIIMSLCSPGGAGKTYSALRLGTGMQRILGGKLFCIDTEHNRALDYTEFFPPFYHVPLDPPYDSTSYQDAIQYCADQGASVIVVDSMSHEHDGEGGHLDLREQEHARLVREWRLENAPDKANQASWIRPKRERKRLIYQIERLPASFIICFRAKERTDFDKKKEERTAKKDGAVWIPSGGKEFVYMMKLALLLAPASDGKPMLDPDKMSPEQRLMFKMEKPFLPFFEKEEQITEELGERLALWSTGGKKLNPEWHKVEAEKRTVTREKSLPEKAAEGPDVSVPCAACKANPPRCKACQIEMLWRMEFVHPKYGKLKALWRCPRKCKDPQDKRRSTNIDALDWHAILNAPPVREPGED